MGIGDYARTECGIAKIKSFEIKNKEVIELDKDIMICNMDCYRNCCTIHQVLKSSPNIIDLIEVGDYVNGHRVIDIAKDQIRALYLEDISQKGALIPVCDYQINSIVTREMFESMEYKVGD